MGLFQKLPEDPVEWAGLPSEPLPDLPAAERLPYGGTIDLDAVPGVGSISISIPTDLPASVAEGDAD
ncbi:hypothetical protein GCM10009775_30890 [Microbacterium aoyamense]|uniref:Uncharacterized protein n=1 Tax=Microbacterium aoyamense TaxID=344166 RepID=A0ABN2Q003_9MICO|nr:hypothetical protein [Microbacterium aoyamense]